MYQSTTMARRPSLALYTSSNVSAHAHHTHSLVRSVSLSTDNQLNEEERSYHLPSHWSYPLVCRLVQKSLILCWTKVLRPTRSKYVALSCILLVATMANRVASRRTNCHSVEMKWGHGEMMSDKMRWMLWTFLRDAAWRPTFAVCDSLTDRLLIGLM